MSCSKSVDFSLKMVSQRNGAIMKAEVSLTSWVVGLAVEGCILAVLVFLFWRPAVVVALVYGAAPRQPSCPLVGVAMASVGASALTGGVLVSWLGVAAAAVLVPAL